MIEKIEIPTECPTCGEKLVLRNAQLFCINTECPAIVSKQLQHFIKTMNIKGLGEKTLEKLGIESIIELYALTEDTIATLIGSEKLAEKIYAQIEASKSAELEKVISAFGIPLVGKTIAGRIVPYISSIDDITLEVCKQAKIGEKAANNLVIFLQGEFSEIREFLPFSFKSNQVLKNTEKVQNNGKVVCMTGKLLSYKTKAEAKEVLEARGFTVVGSVTRNTTYLVDEDNKGSSKRVKADMLSIGIITNLKTFLQEN